MTPPWLARGRAALSALPLVSKGPGKRFVRIGLWLSWPVIIAAKRLSAAPLFRRIVDPFFRRPHNELTTIPIGVDLNLPPSVPLPRSLVEKIVAKIDEKFILDECLCRAHNGVAGRARGVGCMALGPSIARMNPSHGRRVTTEEAIAHVRLAGELGLIANIAHVWIDPLAFGLTFKQLLFICFCDDESCIYRTHLKRRGPNLDGAYQRLPGVRVSVQTERCDGCGACVEPCFVAAIRLEQGRAIIDESCKGCGRCVEICPQDSIVLQLADEESLLRQLEQRIRAVADIPGIGVPERSASGVHRVY
jgi:ferredoxin